MRDREVDFQARGARVAAIGVGDLAAARDFRDASGITFPLLVDAGREAYRAAGLRSASLLHLLRRDNLAARRRARAAGHRQGRTGSHPFQLGGSFVFGPGDVDRYARASETFGDVAPLSELLTALER